MFNDLKLWLLITKNTFALNCFLCPKGPPNKKSKKSASHHVIECGTSEKREFLQSGSVLKITLMNGSQHEGPEINELQKIQSECYQTRNLIILYLELLYNLIA